MLARCRTLGGEVGELTVTIGGERGAESEMVEAGRSGILEVCCRGRGGLAAIGSAPPVLDHGEDARGMSSEALVRC